MKTLLTASLVFFSLGVIAQPEKKSVVIGSMLNRPNALLIVNPQNSDQGVLLPQLSSGQRMSMKPSSPAEDGLIVFDVNAQSYFFWSNGNWEKIGVQRQNRFYSIDPAGFQELKPDDEIRHNNMVIFESDNSFVTTSRADAGEEIMAPINLPHGAVVNEITIYYMDNHPANLTVAIMRKSLAGGIDEIVKWQSAGASAAINSQSIADLKGKEIIDLENYTYRVIVTFDQGREDGIDSPENARQRLYGIRIKYQE